MTCDKAQNLIMVYAENRIKPLQSLELHKHIENCPDCRETFLIFCSAMDICGSDSLDGLDEKETEEKILSDVIFSAPDGFTEAVMAKIADEPIYIKKAEKKSSIGWLRLIGCAYAACLSVLIVLLYGTDLISMDLIASPTVIETAEQASTFFAVIATTVQNGITNLAAASVTVGNYLLIIWMLMTAALTFVLIKEKSKWSRDDA